MAPEQRSGIEVNTRFNLLAFILFFCTPHIWIDGVEHERPWGTHMFPVKPGPHTVRIFFRYLFWAEAGENRIDVHVANGLMTRIRYKAPWLILLRGQIQEIAPIEAPATLEVAESRSKKCPRCAEGIKIEAKVCRHCGYEFDAAAVEEAIRHASAAEAQASADAALATARMKAAQAQVARYHALRRKRGEGLAVTGIGIALAVVLVGTLIAAAVQQFPAGLAPPIVGSIILGGFAGGLVYAGRKTIGRSASMLAELEEDARKHGNYFRCSCGRPKEKFYWLHYTLSLVLFPYGLLSLFFPLKRCRGCGLSYFSSPHRVSVTA